MDRVEFEPSPSTISREIQHNGGLDCYRASRADKAAWNRAYRPKLCKLALHAELRDAVVIKLELEWSSQQIADWLKQKYPGDESKQVSHETIYITLFMQAKNKTSEDRFLTVMTCSFALLL